MNLEKQNKRRNSCRKSNIPCIFLIRVGAFVRFDSNQILIPIPTRSDKIASYAVAPSPALPRAGHLGRSVPTLTAAHPSTGAAPHLQAPLTVFFLSRRRGTMGRERREEDEEERWDGSDAKRSAVSHDAKRHELGWNWAESRRVA